MRKPFIITLNEKTERDMFNFNQRVTYADAGGSLILIRTEDMPRLYCIYILVLHVFACTAHSLCTVYSCIMEVVLIV